MIPEHGAGGLLLDLMAFLLQSLTVSCLVIHAERNHQRYQYSTDDTQLNIFLTAESGGSLEVLSKCLETIIDEGQ